MIKPVLTVKNLTIQFPASFFRTPKKVINNLSFTLFPGQLVCIVGKNGSGKTTLIKAICELVTSYSGNIVLDKKSIGYVPEKYNGPSFITTHQCLYCMGRLCGIDKKKLHKKIDILLNTFNLSQYTNEKIGNLSKGTTQRLYIAQAIIDNPKILIMDEPFSGLDHESTKQLKQYIKNLAKHRTAVICSAHVADKTIFDTFIRL